MIEFNGKYNEVLEKHEEYEFECDGDPQAITEMEHWIEDVEEGYDELQRKYQKYVKEHVAHSSNRGRPKKRIGKVELLK